MTSVVEYYLVPHSPWTYLGHARFRAIAKAAGATIEPRPFDLGKVFPVSGGLPLPKRAPQRQAYRLVELRRFKEHLGMPLVIQRRFFPVDADLATRLIIAVQRADGPERALDDAIDKVLQALRPVADARGGQLVALFGAGGDRDPTKRALMGAAASRQSDRVVLTCDNPRSEDPLAIIEAIRAGVTVPCRVEPDRERAIRQAVREAASADVVLLAGKGHETYQEIAGERRPFSDATCARAALAQRAAP